MAKKPLVDKNYELCQGCRAVWFLSAQGTYACDKCLIKSLLHEAKSMVDLAYEYLQDVEIGIKQRPMIERD
jgi:hypothetical protein